MSKQLKHWFEIYSKNKTLLNRILPSIACKIKGDPETVNVLNGDLQLRNKQLFVFKIIITCDVYSYLVDANTNAYHNHSEVISIDFVKFDIINEHEVSILTDLQTRLIRNAVDSYLRYNYTI